MHVPDLRGGRIDAVICKYIIPYPGSDLHCQQENTTLVTSTEHNGTNLYEGHLSLTLG